VLLKIEVRLPGRGISGGEIDLKFDPAVFRVEGLEPGDLLGPEPLKVERIDNSTGEVKYALARVGPTAAPTPPGTFALVRLRVLDTARAGRYNLGLTKVGLVDHEFKDIPDITVQGAAVEIKS